MAMDRLFEFLQSTFSEETKLKLSRGALFEIIFATILWTRWTFKTDGVPRYSLTEEIFMESLMKERSWSTVPFKLLVMSNWDFSLLLLICTSCILVCYGC